MAKQEVICMIFRCDRQLCREFWIRRSQRSGWPRNRNQACMKIPQIPNFAQKRRGIRLVPGMTLAIEPMITMGRPEVCWLDDDWTVVTEDESLAAHYENTILITGGTNLEILTLTK